MGLDWDYTSAWVEYFAMFSMVIGIFLSTNAQNIIVSLILAFLSGGIFGRIYVRWKNSFKITLYIITISFLIGLIVGNWFENILITIIVFIIGWRLSFWLHEKKYIKSLEW